MHVAIARVDVKVELDKTFDWRAGGGSSTTYVDRVVRGMLMVDVIDAKTKKLVWRATATDTITDNRQKNEKKIHKAVEKMFEKYPAAGTSR
jgi:hypothetical protein